MYINEITIDTFKKYLRIEFNDDDEILSIMLSSAKSYIKSKTGLTEDQINLHDDLTIAMLVLCNDMYSNRQYTVNDNKINPVIDNILSMYRVNLL